MPLLFGRQLLRALSRMGWYADDADAEAWVRPGGITLPADVGGWQQETRVQRVNGTLAAGVNGLFTIWEGDGTDPVKVLRVNAILGKSGAEEWAGRAVVGMVAPGNSDECLLTKQVDLARYYEAGSSPADLLYLEWQPPSECWFAGVYRIYLVVLNSTGSPMEWVGEILYNHYPQEAQ